MAASESTTVRMLFAMLRQMPVKNMDWNKVACDPALSEPISNGHAARMRYARLRQALETNTEVPGVDSSATKTTRQKGGVKKSKASAKPKQKKLPAQAQEQVLRSLEAQNIPPVKMEPFIKNEALDVDFSDCLATDPLMASPPFGIKGDTTTNSQHHFVHPFLSAPTSPDMAMMPEFTMGIGNADLQPRLLTPRSEQLFPSPQIGNQFDDFDLGQNGTSFEDAAFSTVIMAGLNGYNSQSLSLDGGVDPASVPLFVPDTDLTAGDICEQNLFHVPHKMDGRALELYMRQRQQQKQRELARQQHGHFGFFSAAMPFSSPSVAAEAHVQNHASTPRAFLSHSILPSRRLSNNGSTI